MPSGACLRAFRIEQFFSPWPSFFWRQEKQEKRELFPNSGKLAESIKSGTHTQHSSFEENKTEN